MQIERSLTPTQAGRAVAAGCPVIVLLSGCASYGTPYGDD